MPRLKTQPDELAQLSDDSTQEFQRISDRMVAAVFLGDGERMASAVAAMQTLLSNTLTLADLMGRRRVILQSKAMSEGHGLDTGDPFGAPIMFREPDTISEVTNATRFDEAVDDIVERTPELAETVAGEPRYKAIQRLYRDRHGFGLAKSYEIKITERVQNIIKRSLDVGTPVQNSIEAIQAAGPFTESYADMVYRTNLSTTYTAGTFEQLKDPRVQLVFGALEFHSIVDSDTRPNHQAAHGLIAPITSKVWDSLSPPLFYNCRCSVFPVDRWTLEEKGLIMKNGQIRVQLPGGAKIDRDISGIPGAGPDESGSGFGQRPNAKIYG